MANNRKNFAGIGTNKAKKRLNKLADKNMIAKAIRLALEIENKNISAKNSYGEYKLRIYTQKENMILDLCKIFHENNWIYEIQKTNNRSACHIIYFDIPTCEQIYWHFSPKKDQQIPSYPKEWDQKPNTTLLKLEQTTLKLLKPQKNEITNPHRN